MNDLQFNFSSYGKASATPSPINRMMASFATDFRTDIDINLGVGYISEAVIQRELIRKAQNRILEDLDNYPNLLNYGASSGTNRLIRSIRDFIISTKLGELTEDMLAKKRIIIGANGATSILENIPELLEPGLVITSDPIYYIYSNFLERKGFRIVAIPEDDQGIRITRVQELIKKKWINANEISFVYVATVNNPTCTILSDERCHQLVELVTQLSRKIGRRIPIFFDRAYDNIIHNPEAKSPVSGFHFDELGLAYEIGSLSKVIAPGIRIGYIIGAPDEFMSVMVQRTSDIGFSASPLNQEIASYLLDHHGCSIVESAKKIYWEKAKSVRELIEKYLGPNLKKITGGNASFYFYITLNKIPTDQQSRFYKFLTRTTEDPDIDGPERNKKPRVIYIPGTYCVQQSGALVNEGKTQLRLSYGYSSVAEIEKGIKIMAEAIKFVQET